MAKYRHSKRYLGRERKWAVRTLVRRDGARCRYCKRDLEAKKITLDHILAKSLGGTDDISNLCLACEECNQAKGQMTEDEYLLLQIS